MIDGQPFTTDASGKKVPLDRRTARITEQKLPSEFQIPREPGEKPDRLSSVGGFTTLLAYVAGRGFDDHPDGVGTPALPGQYLELQHALHADRAHRSGSIRGRACGSRRSR